MARTNQTKGLDSGSTSRLSIGLIDGGCFDVIVVITFFAFVVAVHLILISLLQPWPQVKLLLQGPHHVQRPTDGTLARRQSHLHFVNQDVLIVAPTIVDAVIAGSLEHEYLLLFFLLLCHQQLGVLFIFICIGVATSKHLDVCERLWNHVERG